MQQTGSVDQTNADFIDTSIIFQANTTIIVVN